MPKHGTTDHCGPACDHLLEQKNGPQRHLFCVELAVDHDRNRAFRAAGYSGADPRTGAAQLLANNDTREAYFEHARAMDGNIADRGEQLREDAHRQARTNLFDLVVAQDPDSEAMQRLETLIIKGVEVVDPKTGERKWRPASAKEKQRAIENAARVRMKRPEEIPVELQMMIDEFSEDPSRGIIKYKIDRHKAREFFAKTTGMIVERKAISLELAEKTQRQLLEMMMAIQDAEIPLMLADRQAWATHALGRARAAAERRLEAAAPGSEAEEKARMDLARLGEAPEQLPDTAMSTVLNELLMVQVWEAEP